MARTCGKIKVQSSDALLGWNDDRLHLSEKRSTWLPDGARLSLELLELLHCGRQRNTNTRIAVHFVRFVGLQESEKKIYYGDSSQNWPQWLNFYLKIVRAYEKGVFWHSFRFSRSRASARCEMLKLEILVVLGSAEKDIHHLEKVYLHQHSLIVQAFN